MGYLAITTWVPIFIIVVFLQNATIEYSSESLCVCIRVCVCVFLQLKKKSI